MSLSLSLRSEYQSGLDVDACQEGNLLQSRVSSTEDGAKVDQQESMDSKPDDVRKPQEHGQWNASTQTEEPSYKDSVEKVTEESEEEAPSTSTSIFENQATFAEDANAGEWSQSGPQVVARRSYSTQHSFIQFKPKKESGQDRKRWFMWFCKASTGVTQWSRWSRGQLKRSLLITAGIVRVLYIL